MYILMLTRGIPTKEEPIWGIFEMQQAIALKNAGHKVVIGFIDERLKSKERFLCVFKSIGIHKKNNNGILVYDVFICQGVLLNGWVLKNILDFWTGNMNNCLNV